MTEVIERLRVALEREDLSTAEALLADDAALHIPGRSGLSGPYHGRDAISGFFEKLASVTGGGFRFRPERVAGDENLAMMLGEVACQQGGRSRRAPAVLAVRTKAGRITEIRVFRHDQPGLDELCL